MSKVTSRILVKEIKDQGRGGLWKSRLRWYNLVGGGNIRLQLDLKEHRDHKWHLYPASREQADEIWEAFRVVKPTTVEEAAEFVVVLECPQEEGRWPKR